jgi:hypothetical protein
VRQRGANHLNASLPSIADVAAMTSAERVALAVRLDGYAEAIAAARGALRAFLFEPPPSAPLIDAREAARRLGVSVDTVRARGTEWGIEACLGDDLKRYRPEDVEAARHRRRSREQQA